MTDIASIGQPFGQAQPSPAARVGRAAEPVRPAQPSVERAGSTAGAGRLADDTIEVSEQARLLAKMRSLPEIRRDLVDRVRAEIAAGTYETPERLQVALSRLVEDVANEG